MTGGKQHSEAAWGTQPDHDRLEYGLMFGYVVIALIAVINGAHARIGGGLSTAVPDSNPASSPAQSILELLQTSADFVAAVALLVFSGFILYRRRRNRLKAAEDPSAQRFELPFLF
jgi:hypothetical protein